MNKSPAYFISVLLVLILFYACGKEINHDAEISRIDSLMVDMKAHISDITASELPDTGKTLIPLKLIQENFVGVMNENMALHLDQFSRIRRESLELEIWRDSIESKYLKQEKSLSGLRIALKEKATHDELNNELTTEYISNAINIETRNSSALVNGIESWLNTYNKLMSEYGRIDPLIEHWADSIVVKNI